MQKYVFNQEKKGTTEATGKVAVIVGASSGIGAAIARQLNEAGHTVFGVSRSAAASISETPLTMDVTDEASVASTLQAIHQSAGRIDALIHCAGISIAGAIEDTSIDEAKKLFDTNYFGAVRTVRTILPLMRGQGFGQIMLVGSIGGLIGLPYIAHYSASKFALDGFMQALRTEIQPFGIQATVIHPGDFRTDIAKNQIMAECANAASAYAGICERTVDLYTKNVDAAPEPVAIAELVARLLKRKQLAPNYIVGSPVEKVAVGLKSWIPAGSFEFVMRKAYGH